MRRCSPVRDAQTTKPPHGISVDPVTKGVQAPHAAFFSSSASAAEPVVLKVSLLQCVKKATVVGKARDMPGSN